MTLIPFQEIVETLRARPQRVAEKYAPNGYIEKGKYWALNPGRHDKSIGSFYVNLTGSYAGRWHDHATGDGGDMLDLIQMAIGSDRRGALEEARAFLGMAEETPKQKALRERQTARENDERERAAADLEAQRLKTRGKAQSLWMRSQERLEGTPVAEYLAARSIVLDRLGRIPHAIRYHPELYYTHTEDETGEVIEKRLPGMVTAIHGPVIEGERPAFYGVHRTYLARRADGVMWKAGADQDVIEAKKVWGCQKGGFMRIWSGLGPQGGKGPSLSRARQGDRVYVTEGIEDALSVAVLKPHARVLAAISVENFREITLPPAVTHVTLVADNDPGAQAQAALEKAVLRLAQSGPNGRHVTVWRNEYGGKDLNDALMLADQAEGVA